MKRFHVHLHVDDLAKSIAFYSDDLGIQAENESELDIGQIQKAAQ